MTEAIFKYLRPEDICSLNSLEFAPKIFVEGLLAGRHRAAMRGFSTEFRDYRQYAPGDDLHAIDWKAYARSDRYYIRTFEQETDLTCYIFLDSSASMGFGQPLSKLAYSSFFAAGLIYLVIKNRDLVSLLLFDDTLRAFHPPSSTGKQLKVLLNALERNIPGKPTSLATALTKAYPLLRRKGIVVIISDFLDDPAKIFAALNLYLHRGFAIKLFQILDPHEIELEDRGLATFLDMETASRVVIHTEALRSNYSKLIHEHARNLRQLAVRRKIEFVGARTDQHHFHLFQRFLP